MSAPPPGYDSVVLKEGEESKPNAFNLPDVPGSTQKTDVKFIFYFFGAKMKNLLFFEKSLDAYDLPSVPGKVKLVVSDGLEPIQLIYRSG